MRHNYFTLNIIFIFISSRGPRSCTGFLVNRKTNNNMISTVGDVTCLISSASREEFSHAAMTSREVASATATVVVAVTAAVSAATLVVTDVTSLCRQAGTLNPAGPGHLHPWPLDLSSGSVRSASLVASAAVIFSRISCSKRSTTLISLSHGVAGSSPQMLKSPVMLGSAGLVSITLKPWKPLVNRKSFWLDRNSDRLFRRPSSNPSVYLLGTCSSSSQHASLTQVLSTCPKFLSKLGSLCLPLGAAWCPPVPSFGHQFSALVPPPLFSS